MSWLPWTGCPVVAQVVEDGYEFFADRQLVTIFSAPNYCGEFNNAGAVMAVDESLMCSFRIIKPADKQKFSVGSGMSHRAATPVSGRLCCLCAAMTQAFPLSHCSSPVWQVGGPRLCWRALMVICAAQGGPLPLLKPCVLRFAFCVLRFAFCVLTCRRRLSPVHADHATSCIRSEE